MLITYIGCVPLVLSRSGSLIRDHSDHGRSNDPMNPCSEWIHRFIWSTMIRVISDHWSWSGSPIRKAPIYPGDRHVLNPNMLFLNVCLSFVIKIHVRQKWGIHYWKFQNFQSFVWRSVWVPGWHQLGDLAWACFVCLFFLLFQPVFCPFPTAEPCSRLCATVRSTVDSTSFILLHRWVILRAPNDRMIKKNTSGMSQIVFFYDLKPVYNG